MSSESEDEDFLSADEGSSESESDCGSGSNNDCKPASRDLHTGKDSSVLSEDENKTAKHMQFAENQQTLPLDSLGLCLGSKSTSEETQISRESNMENCRMESGSYHSGPRVNVTEEVSNDKDLQENVMVSIRSIEDKLDSDNKVGSLSDLQSHVDCVESVPKLLKKTDEINKNDRIDTQSTLVSESTEKLLKISSANTKHLEAMTHQTVTASSANLPATVNDKAADSLVTDKKFEGDFSSNLEMPQKPKEDKFDMPSKLKEQILKMPSKFQEEILETLPKFQEDKMEIPQKLLELDEPKPEIKESSRPTKEIKESKIGRKKPRERLGERLGNKKIGARVTKPLVGISSDVIQHKIESTDKEQSSLVVSEEENISEELEKLSIGSEKEIHKVLNPSDNTAAPQWGLAWGDWGSSFMTAASSLSKEVSRGVGTVLETVEVGLGAPSPSELAKEIVEREKMMKQLDELGAEESECKEKSDESKESSNFGFGFSSIGSLVSGVSGAFETAGNKVLLGGLDTLERIGRRTMDIIQDGDPGLRRKRAFLSANKQNLSSVLREARERAIEREEGDTHNDCDETDRCRVAVQLVWDNTEGPAHLEALSLVAKQCKGKTWNILQEIPSVYRQETEQRIQDIIRLSTIEEEDRVDNIHKTLMDITRDVHLPLQFNKLITGWPALHDSLSKLSIEICGLGSIDLDLRTVQTDLYEQVCRYVALVAAVAHKAAELAIITPELDGLKLARQFQQLCGCISGGLETSADDICGSISKTLTASDPNFNDTITNIYVQMAEVNSYLEKSLIDLIAVIAHIEAKKTLDDL